MSAEEVDEEMQNMISPFSEAGAVLFTVAGLPGDVYSLAKTSITVTKMVMNCIGIHYYSVIGSALRDEKEYRPCFDKLIDACDKVIIAAESSKADDLHSALRHEKDVIKLAYIQAKSYDDRIKGSMSFYSLWEVPYTAMKNQIACFRHHLEERYCYITLLLDKDSKKLNVEKGPAWTLSDTKLPAPPDEFFWISKTKLDLLGALSDPEDSDVRHIYLTKGSKIAINLWEGYYPNTDGPYTFKFYVKYGSAPTEYSYGWKGEKYGVINIDKTGTYYFMVRGNGYGEYRLKVKEYPWYYPVGKPLDKELLVFSCPVHVTITDKSGRVITDTGINEIPNANIIVKGEEKIFYLPLDCTYSTEINAYDSGTFNFTRFSQIGNDISITKFESIPVTSNTKASVEIEPGVTDYTMSIDYNGDGVTDEEKSPDVNETMVNVGPENDYAKESYIKVVSGTIAGQDINPNNPEITVSSAKKISGRFDISVRNTGHSGSIFPIVANPNWGPHESSYWSITGHQAPGIKTHTVNVDLNAPSKPGVYYIVVAGQWELSAANVASGTNWVVGENHWNDGNDLADWSTSMIVQAIKSGLVIADWEKVEGMVKMYVPATAIRVKVTEEPEKDVIEIPIRSGKDDGYFMTFVSDSINDTSDILIGQVAADIFSLKFSTFMRFPNVAIPKDAKITKAYITVVPTFTNQSGPLMKITATDQSNPTIPKDYSDYSNRLRTKASVDWDASNWNEGVSVNSPDISSVIQELVDSYDYLTGAPILFFLDDADTEMRTKYQLFAAYEHTEHEPAKLHIEYITGGESESPLKITITSDKEEYSPGDIVNITTRFEIIHDTPEEPVIITNPISTTFTIDGELVFEDVSPGLERYTFIGETWLERSECHTIPEDAPEGYCDVTVSFSGGKYVKTAENLFFVKADDVPGDVTGDGRVDYKDLTGVIEHWGAIDTKYDVDRSGTVGYSDVKFILDHWTASKPYGRATTTVKGPVTVPLGSSFKVRIKTDGTVEAAHISVIFPSELKIETINVDPDVDFDFSTYQNGTDWIDVIAAEAPGLPTGYPEAPLLAEICFTATEEGTYTIDLSSVLNGEANDVEALTVGVVKAGGIDAIPPTISNIKVSPTYALPGESINISADVFDSSGVRWVRAYINKDGELVCTVFLSDPDEGGVYTGTWQTMNFTESGIYNIEISAIDTVGNEILVLKAAEVEIT